MCKTVTAQETFQSAATLLKVVSCGVELVAPCNESPNNLTKKRFVQL